MTDQLRELAQKVVDSVGSPGPRPSVSGALVQKLKAVLADSATIKDALAVSASAHGGDEGWDKDPSTTADAPPKSKDAALMREAARDLDWMASRAAGHAKRLGISVGLCEAATRLDADAPPEPTEEEARVKMTGLDFDNMERVVELARERHPEAAVVESYPLRSDRDLQQIADTWVEDLAAAHTKQEG